MVHLRSVPANEQWRTVTAYDGDTTLVIPPTGETPEATVVDARGQVIERIEYLRDPDDDAAADTSAEVLALPSQSTAYEYDAARLLVEMRDPDDNSWAYDYDWGGRLVTSDDPDAGTTTTTYDVGDRVVTQTDGNSETLAYTYDVLGRTTTLRDDSVTGTIRTQWTYDESLDEDGDPVLGQLSSSTRFVDGQAYTTSVDRYDDAYRSIATTFTLPDLPEYADALDSLSYTTEYTYAADGQVASETLPAIVSDEGSKVLGAETVTTRFDTASVPSWTSGGFGWGTYVAESRVTSDGRVLALDLGNTYGAYVSYQYEDGTERLANISLTRQGYVAELSLGYGYDAAGNVTSIFDQASSVAAGQDNQCFGYDGLSRLEVAWASSSGDCSVAQSELTTADVGGVSPYWTEYEYDALGNRTQQVEHAVDGGSDVVTDYSHGDAGLGAHQLGELVESVDGVSTTTTSFAYDDSGNRTSTATDGDATAYEWDVEGELVGVDDAEYVYDASGGRIVRADESGTTVYLPGGQELLISPEGGVSATRYYSFGGQTVAVRESSGLGGVDSLVVDHQGSVVAAVPNTEWAAGSVEVVRTDPFGGVRDGSDEGVPGDKGFLGLTHDESSGLSLLGARYYDSDTGTFLSVDPVLDPDIPAQFNAYVYGWNNPVTHADPTGLEPASEKKGLGNKGKTGPWSTGPDSDHPFSQGIEALMENLVDRSGWVEATQNGSFDDDFPGWGFDLENGVSTTRADAWQLGWGYNDVVDVVFDIGTDMDSDTFEFKYGDDYYVFWVWKGDYLNMGAGAEIGLYREALRVGDEVLHWSTVSNSDAPMMTVNLRGPDGDIGSFTPDDPQAWVGLYNSNVQDPAAGSLSVEYTITFPESGMYDAFRKVQSDNGGWVWNRDSRTVMFGFRRRRLW